MRKDADMDIELSDQQLLVDRTTAMRMLGLKVTLNTYAAVFADRRDAVSDAVSDAFSRELS